MKKEMHPEMKKVVVTCACGATYETLSTKENLRTEVCSSCHPVYTGKRVKSATRGGRVERFRRKYNYQDE